MMLACARGLNKGMQDFSQHVHHESLEQRHTDQYSALNSRIITLIEYCQVSHRPIPGPGENNFGDHRQSNQGAKL